MADWKTTCNIKQFLHRDDMDNAEVCTRIADTLNANSRVTSAPGGDLLVEQFRDAAHDYKTGKEEGHDAVNSLLSELYDFADRERIWLGL